MSKELVDQLDRVAERCNCDWSYRIPENGREYTAVYFQKKPSYTVDELISIQTGRDNGQGRLYTPSALATTLKDLRKAQSELGIARFSREDMQKAAERWTQSPTFFTFVKMEDIWGI